MIALARIRAMGVHVERAGGGLRLRPALPAAVDLARAHKPEIVKALGSEVFDGPSYATSPYLVWIESVYDRAHALKDNAIVSAQARRIMAICMERDAAFERSHTDGIECVDRTRAELVALADEIAIASGYMLTGDRLAEAVRREAAMLGRNVGALE